jgi:hypothetical protein
MASLCLVMLARLLRTPYLYVVAGTAALSIPLLFAPEEHRRAGVDMLLLFWMFGSSLCLLGSWGTVIRWYYPFPFMLSLYSLYAFCGLGVYVLRDLYWFNWPADISAAGDALLVGLAGLVAGYVAWLVLTLRKRASLALPTCWGWNCKRLRIAVHATLLLGTVGAYFTFDHFKNIPLFAEDTEAARLLIAQSSPKLFWPLWNVLMHTLPLAYVLYRVEGRTPVARLRLVTVSVYSLALLGLYAARSVLLFPVILTLLIYVHELSPRFSLRRAGAVAVAAIAFSMLFIGYRAQRGGSDVGLAASWMVGDLFPEVRTFALALHEAPELRVGDQTVSSLAVGLVPSGVLTVLGVDKAAVWRPIGGIFRDKLGFSNILGLRLSLAGELYFIGGWFAIALTMSLIGLLLGVLDYCVRDASDAVHRYPYVLAGLLTALLVPYGTAFLLTCLWVGVPGFGIAWFCQTSRPRARVA